MRGRAAPGFLTMLPVGLLLLAGFYRMVSGFLNSSGVELDAGIPGFPE